MPKIDDNENISCIVNVKQPISAIQGIGNKSESDAEKWVELIKQYASPTELTTELLNTLIEKIVVHEAVKSPDG